MDSTLITQEEPPQASKLTEEDIRRSLSDANQLKEEGTQHFRNSQWREALLSYQTALDGLPKRKVKKSNATPPLDDMGMPPSTEEAAQSVSNEDQPEDTDQEHILETPIEKECAKLRSILNGNISACYVKLGDHPNTVQACSASLEDDPVYIKVLQRRISSNEQLNTWSSLSAAQTDIENLLNILPPTDPSIRGLRMKSDRLKPRAEAAQKAETAEMMGKLKDLGNSFLGNFGLSTDNFKFEPNGQGGYSMNFSQ